MTFPLRPEGTGGVGGVGVPPGTAPVPAASGPEPSLDFSAAIAARAALSEAMAASAELLAASLAERISSVTTEEGDVGLSAGTGAASCGALGAALPFGAGAANTTEGRLKPASASTTPLRKKLILVSVSGTALWRVGGWGRSRRLEYRVEKKTILAFLGIRIWRRLLEKLQDFGVGTARAETASRVKEGIRNLRAAFWCPGRHRDAPAENTAV
jgi:hypothetical protein